VVNVAGNEHRLAAAERVFFIANGDLRSAAGDYPCFVTMTVPLKRESRFGVYGESLRLEPGTTRQNFE
jgi:hypothetical protein